jgi:DNA replication and repair protein RecF
MLKKISITNYRNISQLDTELSPNSNLIIAPNSSGKTNFLESIYYSISGSSFHPILNNAEIIGPDAEYCKIEAEWHSDQLEFVASNTNNHLSRKFSINKKRYPINKVMQKFPVVIFAPNSVDLVSGEPSARRNDLDSYLSMINPDYKNFIERYKTLLKNRNALIKQIRDGRSARSELDYWTEELVKYADHIYSLRRDFFNSIQSFITQTAQSLEIFLHDNLYQNLEINFVPNIDSSVEEFKATLSQKFQENREKEIIVGKTLYGIHKDDYYLSLNGKNVRYFGSRGQQRLAAFLIKASQFRYFKNSFDRVPLFLIDDLMSELDKQHRNRIGEYLLAQQFQFVLTSAEKFEISESLFTNSTLLSLGTK